MKLNKLRTTLFDRLAADIAEQIKSNVNLS